MGKERELTSMQWSTLGQQKISSTGPLMRKHHIVITLAKKPREIYLANGKTSGLGPVTHIVKVSMNIGDHREMASLQVAYLQNQ